MTQIRRRRAWLLCLMMVLVLVVSSAYLIHEADHDCEGEACPVCEQIFQTRALLRSFALLWVFWLAFVVTRSTESERVDQSRLLLTVPGTLVSWKVRMDD